MTTLHWILNRLVPTHNEREPALHSLDPGRDILSLERRMQGVSRLGAN